MEGVLRRCEGAKGWGMRNKVRVPCENGAWILSVIAACEGSIEAESHRRPRQQLPERDLAGRKRAHLKPPPSGPYGRDETKARGAFEPRPSKERVAEVASILLP